jgi:hypothetical protein
VHAPPLRRSFAGTFLLGSLVVALALSGCGSSSGGGTPVAQADTTVLVYVIGANLESQGQQASQNIQEMMGVGSTAGMNVVLQTGGANAQGTPPVNPRSMQPRGIDWTHVQRYHVHLGSLEQLADLGQDEPGTLLDMGSASTFEGFLEWGVTTYPAKRYIVVLWDHGGGVNAGVGPDEVTESTLPVSGIREALTTVSADLGQKFTVVGFDTCLMGTAEVAASLAPSTSYFVASQDLEPGAGWDYRTFLDYVSKHASATGAEIGQVIVDGYVEKSTRQDATYPVTLAVTDLSRARELVDATDAFATALLPYARTTDGWKKIALARMGALDWETSAIFGMATDLVDMDGFVNEVVQRFPSDANLGAKGKAVRDAIGAAVAYSRGTGSDARATGLTLYFPSVMPQFVAEDRPALGRWTYATNTTEDGSPYFAPSYTNGTTGLVRKYYEYYSAAALELQASVTMPMDPANYLAGKVSNEFDYALASHRRSDACKLYKGAKATAPVILAPCFDGMQVAARDPLAAPDGSYQVSLSTTSLWPTLWDFPVVLVPDLVATSRPGISDAPIAYLVPVFLYDDAQGAYVSGFLQVQEQPLQPLPSKYAIMGFQPHSASSPGKVTPLWGGEVLALGAYYADTGEFLRTDRTLIVPPAPPLPARWSIAWKNIGGGSFSYYVTDLTGTVQNPSDVIDYVPWIASFTATPETIVAGQSTALSWTVEGATSMTIEPGVTTSTNPVWVTPATTTTYTLTATNGNSAPMKKSVTVIVTRPPG